MEEGERYLTDYCDKGRHYRKVQEEDVERG